MRTSLHTLPPLLLVVLCSSLAACGGNGDIVTSSSSIGVPSSATTPGSTSATMSSVTAAQSAYIPQSRGTSEKVSPSETSTTPVTSVVVHNSLALSQSSAATTFGQAFVEGDVRVGETLVGRTSDGSAVPLQVDVKARHPDGSLRHAVITVQLTNIAPSGTETVSLYRSSAAAASAQENPTTLLNSGFNAVFNATISGVQYTASADAALRAGRYTTWLSGPLVNEWMVAVPLKTATGATHPHLVARFAIRGYTGNRSARVDVAIENGWAYEAAPQNVTYDAQILVGGLSVFNRPGLEHYHHARWRKIFWWGNASMLDIKHDTTYLIASKAVPKYDQTVPIKEASLAGWQTRWTAAQTGPMQRGLAAAYMPTTGARPDIGPMPAWSALYLLSMDQRLKNITIGMSEQAGSWSSHYRNKRTDRPVTVAEYPYMSLIAKKADTVNPVTKVAEAFPECPDALCSTPLRGDTAHQPDLAYLPYLITGDYYHLEELQFWANWNILSGNPAYRQYQKGLVQSDQIRGQAWSLRTLAQAAYITPDNDPQKVHLNAIVNHNIDWYNTQYTNNPAVNKLGVLEHRAMEYSNSTGVAPWQDDFFTFAVGRLVELGFTRAQPLLEWKSKFVVERMAGEGFCWIEASAYSLKLRDSSNSPLYTSIAQVYQANNTPEFLQLECGSAAMGLSLKKRTGEMVESSSPDGGQAIMQPALAYSANVHNKGKDAWKIYMARPYKPNYVDQPQYAIVPR